MNRLEGSKTAAKVSDIASSATHEHVIDTLGFSYASIDVAFEPVAAGGTNSAVATLLALQHSDNNSDYSAVTGFVPGTDYTIPTPSNTTDSPVVRLNVNLEGKQRYLRVRATPTTAGALSSIVRLGVAEAVPVSASVAGVNTFVSG